MPSLRWRLAKLRWLIVSQYFFMHVYFSNVYISNRDVFWYRDQNLHKLRQLLLKFRLKYWFVWRAIYQTLEKCSILGQNTSKLGYWKLGYHLVFQAIPLCLISWWNTFTVLFDILHLKHAWQGFLTPHPLFKWKSFPRILFIY